MQRSITLREYESQTVTEAQLPTAACRRLIDAYKSQVTVTRVPFQDDSWKLTAAGWVGHIMLPGDVRIILAPKVPLIRLFEMLTTVWQLDPLFESLIGDGVTQSGSIPEFYARLAHWLADGVLTRCRTGLYRAYRTETERLPVVRGRIDPRRLTPNQPNVPCIYEALTADLPHNQLLLYALNGIVRANISTDPRLIKAWRTLRQSITLLPFAQLEKLDRITYTRLNQDYRPLHALCRFFIDQLSPTHADGEHDTLPILVNMAPLFERYVATALQTHLPDGAVTIQEQTRLGSHIKYIVDMVIRDESGRVACVIDTKYKRDKTPSTADFNQAVNYALAHACDRAYLLYPTADITPFTQSNGGVTVESMPFDLTRPLNENIHKVCHIIA